MSSNYINTKKKSTNKGVEYVNFLMYSTEEIRKLSVVKLTTPLTFNAMGRPLPGGVYDRLMGPSIKGREDSCGTCAQSSLYCPGHMGHIELPLPVVNPLLRIELTALLKMICIKCHTFQLSGLIKQKTMAQLKLIKEGYLSEAMEMESILANISSSKDEKEVLDTVIEERIKEYLQNINYENKKEEKFNDTKTSEDLRRLFVSAAIRPRPRRNCLNCKKHLTKIYYYQNKFISSVSEIEIADKFKEPSEEISPTKKSGRGSHRVTISVKPDILRDHLRNLWQNESEFLSALFPIMNNFKGEYPTDIYFMEALLVSPPCMRPIHHAANGRLADNPVTTGFKIILTSALVLQSVCKAVKLGLDSLTEDEKGFVTNFRGSKMEEKLTNAWEHLQADVDHLYDKDLNPTTDSKVVIGLRQIIEKKQGLLRMNMMGKRVNYAARTVITPDPNINIDEIGIPEEFAKRLTFPTPVTPMNVEDLRKMVINGPDVHPGATKIEFEDGYVQILKADKPGQRQAAAKSLLTATSKNKFGYTGLKTVHRHLKNGDALLLNRQPSLHKPSIMAHRARILKGERTFRLHYANCSSYNADFDGDEMNAHLPQDEVARSEAYNLASVCHQYLVPKDGTPLSGLIQDHVISGVKLSMRGRFFSKQDYDQLVFQALANHTGEIKLLPPSIIKPKQLWSGKQILSTIILNILPNNKPALNLEAEAKISVKIWQTKPASKNCFFGGTPLEGNNMSESEVIIRQGELLCGVLDKKHYGAVAYGLVHCVYELYGGTYSAKLLSAFSKIFTYFLQTEGFTLGVADILVLRKADKKRTQFVKESRMVGDEIVKNALELPADTNSDTLTQQLKTAFSKDPKKLASILDNAYKSSLDNYTNEINKVCLPAGLIFKFPVNNLQLMVLSGAKGSTVNTMQISCLLGQIQLEGKRPSLLLSGKSLPSFRRFDTSPRAGGFIDGRFMTGIRPQEYFFHCMAGREGLIDTAVKTSRSGYLQRCLIKHLEGVKVCYDQTVRDSDGTVLQFYYGDDGLDVCKSQLLKDKHLHILKNNSNIINTNEFMEIEKPVSKAKKELKKWHKKNTSNVKYISGFLKFSQNEEFQDISNEINKKTGRSERSEEIMKAWNELDPSEKKKYEKRGKRYPDPISSKYRFDLKFGSLSERLENLIEKYDNDEDIKNIIYHKSLLAQAVPGEPVGILAAQSIGEPSTQMTLNTFHFAGRGDMNVTLGIPRLREIIMMASRNPKTPAMDIPFLPDVSEKTAEKLKLLLTKVTVADVIEKVCVTEKIDVGMVRQYTYTIKFCFLPHKNYKRKYCLKPKQIIDYMEQSFFKKFEDIMRKYMKIKFSAIEEKFEKVKRNKGEDDDDEEENLDDPRGKDGNNTIKVGIDDEFALSSDEEAMDDEDDATTAKIKTKHTGNMDYEESDDDEMNEDDNPEEENNNLEDEEDDIEYKENTEQVKDSDTAKDCESRINAVKGTHAYIQSYNYDIKNELWCEVTIGVDLDSRKIDMSTIIREAVKKTVIWSVPNINQAFVQRNKNTNELMLKVDGINIMEIYKYYKLLDLNRIYVNDIFSFSQVYGIEAARNVLIKEIQQVFGVYGITVDARHLSLVGDYMTSNGDYLSMSRRAMQSNACPFQKLTFESTLYFLRQLIIFDKKDNISSPSAGIVVGQPAKLGTGIFGLIITPECKK